MLIRSHLKSLFIYKFLDEKETDKNLTLGSCELGFYKIYVRLSSEWTTYQTFRMSEGRYTL